MNLQLLSICMRHHPVHILTCQAVKLLAYVVHVLKNRNAHGYIPSPASLLRDYATILLPCVHINIYHIDYNEEATFLVSK